MGISIEECATDVLVIGGGGAAARAAMEAAKYGVSVTLADKGAFGRSGSTPCSGGYALAYGEAGSPEYNSLIKNVLDVGEHACDRSLAEAVVADSQHRLEELLEIGFKLEREEGKVLHAVIFGHARPHVVYFDYHFCDPQAIIRREVLHRGVRVVEWVMITDLLKVGSRVAGAVGVNEKGDIVVFKAKAVVLASGSATRLYPFASASFTTTGDTAYLAYEAGVPLVNMEFTEMTIIPTYNGHVLGSGGGGGFSSFKAYNRLGERFMEKYDQRMEKAPRHMVVRAIYKELEAGNGPFHCAADGKVSRRGIHSVYLRKRLAAGLDWLSQEFYFGIALHRLLGGARIDPESRTCIEGLFAAGEATGAVHGAARLPGMALAENNTIGGRAGRAAAEFAHDQGDAGNVPISAIVDRLLSASSAKGSGGRMTPAEMTARIQQVMWKGSGIIRTEEGLRQALDELAGLEGACLTDVSGTLQQRLEVRNLAFVGRTVALSALNRKESRGNHYRADHPDRDETNPIKLVEITKGERGPIAKLTHP
jgi:fumarate reductase (CoM/CoB) subunit A